MKSATEREDIAYIVVLLGTLENYVIQVQHFHVIISPDVATFRFNPSTAMIVFNMFER